jgi:hypothetical protein
MPQIVHVHAKFYDIDETATSRPSTTRRSSAQFVAGGYSGYWSSEWEGHAFADLGRGRPDRPDRQAARAHPALRPRRLTAVPAVRLRLTDHSVGYPLDGGFRHDGCDHRAQPAPGEAPEPASLDPAERMSVDELRAVPAGAAPVDAAARVRERPHYRGVRRGRRLPDDCRELRDLAKFPTTSKADLRDNYPFGMFAVPAEQVRRIHASSGTTGRPTVVGYTERDLDTWATVMARSIRAAAGGRATGCTSRTATGCSPAGWARTTAPSGSAARSSRSPAG